MKSRQEKEYKMRRIFAVALVFLFAKSMAFSQSELIQINNEKEFRKLAESTIYDGNSFYGKRIELTHDIVLLGDSILPIGVVPDADITVPFQGEFDGLGHTITIKAPFYTYFSFIEEEWGYSRFVQSGLFGFIGRAGIVKNLNIIVENTQLCIGNTLGQIGSLGVIAAMNAGIIMNCNVDGKYSIIGPLDNFYEYGTITGTLTSEGYICSCSSDVDINTNKISIVGGLVGMSGSGLISKSYNTGDIIVEECTSFGGDGRCVGGIVGQNYGTTDKLSPYVLNCINYGKIVTNENVISAGGVVGACMGDGMIFYCGNVGDILSDAQYVGGVVGRLINSSLYGSYQAGCLYDSSAKKIKNEVIGVCWWGNEPAKNNYIIGDCNKNVTPEFFVQKANAYYPKAESILLEYLQADKKLHSIYYMPKPWIISSQKLFPYLDYDITN